MYAVLETGGKQYKVSPGDVVQIEKIKGDFKAGDAVIFDKVLIVDNGATATLGTPFVDGAKVMGSVASIGRSPKIDVVRYKQKSRYFKLRGHRQPYFKVKIESFK